MLVYNGSCGHSQLVVGNVIQTAIRPRTIDLFGHPVYFNQLLDTLYILCACVNQKLAIVVIPQYQITGKVNTVSDFTVYERQSRKLYF